MFYGVLDLLAKPVFAFVHLFSMRRIEYAALNLQSGKHTDFPAGQVESSGKADEAKQMEHAAAPTGGNGDQATLQGH